MTQQEFEKRRQKQWQELVHELEILEGSSMPTLPTSEPRPTGNPARVPELFRKVSRDLALARHRMFDQPLTSRLNHMAIRGYQVLLATPPALGASVIIFFFRGFPQAIRREKTLFWVSLLLFVLPAALMWGLIGADISWAQALLGSSLHSIDGMYGKGEDQVSFLREEYGSNFKMFAFYIWNNVGIDFRLYGGGILFGLGTIFFLIYNGLHLGAVFAYVGEAGAPEKLWSFVAGHSSFELLGMIVVGMAGLKIGLAMLAPGRLPRGEAMAKAGKDGLPLLLGGVAMTAMAAVVEGFWSAQPIPNEVKYIVGIGFWIAHVVYFLFVGRRREVRA